MGLLSSALFDVMPSFRMGCIVSGFDTMDTMTIVVVFPIILSVGEPWLTSSINATLKKYYLFIAINF